MKRLGNVNQNWLAWSPGGLTSTRVVTTCTYLLNIARFYIVSKVPDLISVLIGKDENGSLPVINIQISNNRIGVVMVSGFASCAIDRYAS